MKTTTKPQQKILRQLDQFRFSMKKAQNREPTRFIISNKAAMLLELKEGDRYSGIPVIRQSQAESEA